MDITQPTAEKEGVATQNVPTWTLGESRAWFPAPACPPDFGMMHLQAVAPFGQLMYSGPIPMAPPYPYMQPIGNGIQFQQDLHNPSFSSATPPAPYVLNTPSQAEPRQEAQQGAVQNQSSHHTVLHNAMYARGSGKDARGGSKTGPVSKTFNVPRQNFTSHTKSSNKSEQTRLTAKHRGQAARKTDPYLHQLFQPKVASNAEGLGDTCDWEAKGLGIPKQRAMRFLGKEDFGKVQTTILRQVGTFKRQLNDLHRALIVQREMVTTERNRCQTVSEPCTTQSRAFPENQLPAKVDHMATWFASHYGCYPCADVMYGKHAGVPWWQDATRVFGDPALAAIQQGATNQSAEKQVTSHELVKQKSRASIQHGSNRSQHGNASKDKTKIPSSEGSSDWSEESSVGSDLVHKVDEKSLEPATKKQKTENPGAVTPRAKPANAKSVAGILSALHRQDCET